MASPAKNGSANRLGTQRGQIHTRSSVPVTLRLIPFLNDKARQGAKSCWYGKRPASQLNWKPSARNWPKCTSSRPNTSCPVRPLWTIFRYR